MADKSEKPKFPEESVSKEAISRLADARAQKTEAKDDIREALFFTRPRLCWDIDSNRKTSRKRDEKAEDLATGIGPEVSEDFATEVVSAFFPEGTEWVESTPDISAIQDLEAAEIADVEKSSKERNSIIFSAIRSSNFESELGTSLDPYASIGTIGWWIDKPFNTKPVSVAVVPYKELEFNVEADGSIGDRFRVRWVRVSKLESVIPGVPLPEAISRKVASDKKGWIEVVWAFWRDWSDPENDKWKHVLLVDKIAVHEQELEGEGCLPLVIARFSPDPEYSWGFGPSIKALQDYRVLDVITAATQDRVDIAIAPPIGYPDDGVLDFEGGMEAGKAYRAEMTRDAKELFGNIKSGGDKGFTPAVADLNILTRQLAVVDDADFKRQVADYFSSQSAVAAFQNLAPGDVESMMTSLRADTANGATVAQQQLLTDLQASQEARAKALANDPIGYAASRGYTPPPPALNLTQPDTWAGTFQSLQKGVDVLQARGEVGNISALRPEMLAQMTRVFETATPGESVQLLGSMQQNLRPETYKATLSKLYSSGQGRAAATAGALVGDNPAVAEGILRGQMLLKENPNLAPKKTDDNSLAIDERLPIQAFAAGQEVSRQFLLESATARYADLSHQAGDTTGEFNDTRMQQAIDEVTGGVVDMNGYSVIAPRYGMTQDDFDKRLSQLTDDDLSGVIAKNGSAVRARDVRDQGRLRAIADGRYIVEFGRPEAPMYATKQDGSAFVLDLRDR